MIRKPVISGFFITLFGILFISNGVIADTEIFDETYEVSSGSTFEIRNRNGGVKIQGWNSNEIKIHAIKKTQWGGKLENVKIQVSTGDPFKIETIHLVNKPRVSVSYDIKIPVNVGVKTVKNSNGKIVLENTHGDTDVETSNGKIVIEDVVGNIIASTSNGAIEIEEVMGVVSAFTSNGAIDVEKVTGVVELETSNGPIDAEVPDIGDNGLRVRTNNGSIELDLASDLSAGIEAKTSNGDIEVNELELIVKEVSKERLRGKIGNGGKMISCKTSNGSITLSKLK